MQTDHQLFLAAQAGDQASLGLLLENQRARLHTIALRFFGMSQQAEDAVSDTILIALNKLHTVRQPEHFQSWLIATLRNVCLMQIRSQRKELRLNDAEAVQMADRIASDDDVEEILAASAVKEWVWNALESLSEPLRLTVILRHFGMHASYDEISGVLGIPVGTVRSRLAEARTQLLDRLAFTTDTVFQDRKNEVESFARYYRDHISSFYTGAHEQVLSCYSRDLKFVDNGKRDSEGWKGWRKYVHSDLDYGSVFTPCRFMVSGRLMVMEGKNTNSDIHPDRCPPLTTAVYFHRGNSLFVEQLHMFYARKVPPAKVTT